jgi:hypothetical protein
MANGWKGIIFDKLKESKEKATKGRKEIVPKWCTETADSAMEKALERAEKKALDASYIERVEKLKKELRTKV